MARRSLAEFVRQAWHVVEPGLDLAWNWHIDAICQHLEAVTDGRIKRLLINVPPGHMKSLIVSVFWPAWVWLKRPEWRGLFSSYAMDLAIRDSGRCRDLVMSDWYRDTFNPGWELKGNQNTKTLFENTQNGSRFSLSVGSKATGFRGNCVVCDDPLNAKEQDSAAARKEAITWWDRTMSSRLNDMRSGTRVIIMQRLHVEDLSGHVLERGGYDHLCLPSEFDPERRKTTSIGWTDPRTEPGELLFPELFPQEVLDTARTELGELDFAGQHQQTPFPVGGAMFKREWFTIVDAIPGELTGLVRYWDKAGTEGGGAYTAGSKMGRLTDGRFIVTDMVRGQWAATNRERVIRSTAEMDGKSVSVWLEQEPGSGGKESAENTVLNLAGWDVQIERVTGDKATRARPMAAQAGAGNVLLLRGDWNAAFLSEIEAFPNGKYKDQVDATAGAFNKVVLSAPPAAWAENPFEDYRG